MSWQTLIKQQTHLPSDNGKNGQKQLIPLPGISLIQVAGEEAASFLQNLLTNDVNALAVNQAQLSGFCNPKGRLLTIFRLIRREQDFLIALPKELAEAITQRLTMFKLRSKVDISLAEDLYAFGLLADDAALGAENNWHGKTVDEGLLITQPGQQARYLMVADESGCKAVAQWLDEGWQLGSEAAWQLQDIEAGLPMIFNDSKESFTPQQVNLDLVDGVSFKKGCYPGQEVVARLHYLGSPSRRLFLGRIHDTELPAINTAVTGDNGETLGHVVQAQFSAENQILCQLTMKLSGLEKAAMLAGNEVQSLSALAEEPAAD
ncbi:hypothetical protein [uncultured Methylophaga sp.]|uniref:CAF17-like 4Fe-4S cluster assembly/insertion protein YgfZ n=1 Tax=uncultured Methylophaga sp. TaxID=285271 RepID=UPI002613793E|nr:hypothetical protein [uncultured Methylophaga sp.]